MIGWTKSFGGNGGNDFNYYDPTRRLTRVRSGANAYDGQQCLANLTFTFTNDQGNSTTTNAIGILWSVQQTIDWSVPEGEIVTKVYVTFGKYVNSLQF